MPTVAQCSETYAHARICFLAASLSLERYATLRYVTLRYATLRCASLASRFSAQIIKILSLPHPHPRPHPHLYSYTSPHARGPRSPPHPHEYFPAPPFRLHRSRRRRGGAAAAGAPPRG
eukprot:762638-Prorocentrum_minimum.AAC.4